MYIKCSLSQTTTYIELLHAHQDDLLCVIILEAQGPGSLLVSAMFGDNLIVSQLSGVPLASTRLINIGSGTKIGKLVRGINILERV